MSGRTFSPVLLCAALTAPPAWAATATDLSSFQVVEEPHQYCSSSSCVSDSYVNITGPDATIRFYLRYNGTRWDGDQRSNRTDRQRAEVRGLGVHQNPSQTFDYSSDWRTNSSFRGTSRFTHLFQLKAYDGTMGPPMVTFSVNSGVGSAGLKYCNGSCSSGHTTARGVSWSPATWQNLRIRVRVSTSSGEVRASVNGDALSGVTNTPVYLSGSTDYQPKWGLYRGVDPGMSIGNDTIEHRNVSAHRVDGTPTITPTPTSTPTPTAPPGGGGTWEAQSLGYVTSGASAALQNDTAATGGTWLALLADGPGDYIQFTTPALAEGAYTVALRYKAHPSRGILQASVDGTSLGGTLDQYSGTSGFTARTFGTVTLGAGTHTLRLTCTGRNPSAGAYTLSADTITFTSTGTPSPTPTPTGTATPTPTATPGGTPVEVTPGAAGVTASTSDSNLPANTVDNNLATRWSGNGDGAWIQYDLGTTRTVTHVNVAVYQGNARRNTFDIRVSAGDGMWSTVWSGQSSGTTTAEESYDFGDVAARLVRYVGHGSTATTFNSVTEVSVFAVP